MNLSLANNTFKITRIILVTEILNIILKIKEWDRFITNVIYSCDKISLGLT